MGIFEKTSGLISRLTPSSGDRPPFEGIYIYLLMLLLGYAIADSVILYQRPMLLPKSALPARPPKEKRHQFASMDEYGVIRERNMFNADGVIPPALTSQGKDGEGPGTIDAPPVASELPLELEGTIVHANPKRSVASIHLKAKGERQPFGVGDEIDRMARITSIERRRVVFRNLNNNRLEFIQIPEDSKISFGMKSNAPTAAGTEIMKRGDFDFTVQRADINKYTADLSAILNQARMVPNIVPGSGGRVEGFRFVSIQPGSIYEKLGFKPMDVIKEVNGELVNSPTKGMELYNALKGDNRITLKVERDGREETFSYDINE